MQLAITYILHVVTLGAVREQEINYGDAAAVTWSNLFSSIQRVFMGQISAT